MQQRTRVDFGLELRSSRLSGHRKISCAEIAHRGVSGAGIAHDAMPMESSVSRADMLRRSISGAGGDSWGQAGSAGAAPRSAAVTEIFAASVTRPRPAHRLIRDAKSLH